MLMGQNSNYIFNLPLLRRLTAPTAPVAPRQNTSSSTLGVQNSAFGNLDTLQNIRPAQAIVNNDDRYALFRNLIEQVTTLRNEVYPPNAGQSGETTEPTAGAPLGSGSPYENTSQIPSGPMMHG